LRQGRNGTMVPSGSSSMPCAILSFHVTDMRWLYAIHMTVWWRILHRNKDFCISTCASGVLAL